MDAVGRGKLRIYLGSAPGVGTTHGALAEACRRAADGVHVVVTAVDTHRRERTAELLSRLESVPLHPSGSVDTAAVISRAPRLAVVDDLRNGYNIESDLRILLSDLGAWVAEPGLVLATSELAEPLSVVDAWADVAAPSLRQALAVAV